jgi:hypothetical protein
MKNFVNAERESEFCVLSRSSNGPIGCPRPSLQAVSISAFRWLSDLEAELFAFPGSRYDDQCDSFSQAINDERSQRLAVYMKAFG